MKTIKKYGSFIGGIAIILLLYSSCIPVCDSRSIAVFTNRTNDTLFIGASHFDSIDSVDCQLAPDYSTVDSGLHSAKLTLWHGIVVQDNIIFPDSMFTIDGNYLFNNSDTCYFFLIKLRDANNYSWDEIRMNKRYQRRKVFRNSDGKFNHVIK